MSTKTGELDFFKQTWKYWQVLYNGNVKCCECSRVIDFAPAHCSHLMSKGALPSKRLEIRNLVPMCFNCHQKWEFELRDKMSNKYLIKQKDAIKAEHYQA